MSVPQALLLAHFEHNSPVWDEDTQAFVRTPADPDCEMCQVVPLLKEIHEVWTSGNKEAAVLLYSIQDGYGVPGYVPSQGCDWSGIRDSTPAAIKAMHAAIHA